MSSINLKNNKLIINVGTLSSIGMIYYNIAPKLDKLRSLINVGKKEKVPDVIWDFRNLESKKINMAALTTFLAISKGLSDYYKKPILTLFRWDPYILRFLYDIHFFKVAEEIGSMIWDERLIGGLSKIRPNRDTKIIYFNHYNTETLLTRGLSYSNNVALNDWKECNREIISDKIIIQFGNIFTHNIFYDSWNTHLMAILSDIVGELVINSILHGQSTPFVGIQRSTAGISVCVSDSGVGFLTSIKKSNPWINEINIDSELEAIMYASLMKKENIGLRNVIEDVIISGGWTVVSSNNSKIRWELDNWENAKANFSTSNMKQAKQKVGYILGEQRKKLTFGNNTRKGRYKTYSNTIKGSRIDFEIPLK